MMFSQDGGGAGEPGGAGDAGAGGDLSGRLRELLAGTQPASPLPATRQLGRRLGLANTTVFRALQRLVDAGEAWQHPRNGRFYPMAARALLDRPKPVACLTRRLELCSALYRELLEGISAGSGEARRTMLLWHDELLVNHPDPALPPCFAAPPVQKAILKDFLDHHGESAGGFVLDHVWSDEALQRVSRRLQPAVLLYRRAPAGLGVANAYADFGAAATQSLAHLLGRGFTRIVPVRPFEGDPAVEEFLVRLRDEARSLGCEARLAEPTPAETLQLRAGLIRRITGKQRIAFVVPEDHMAVRLHEELRAAGKACPRDAGVFSVMGTAVGEAAGLSRLHFDFREMGRTAVKLLQDRSPTAAAAFAPEMRVGGTT